jgi:hypothetical protein
VSEHQFKVSKFQDQAQVDMFQANIPIIEEPTINESMIVENIVL